MNLKRANMQLLIGCSILLGGWSVGIAAEWKAPGKNLAAGKPYTFNGRPGDTRGNFKLTAADDAQDLTDVKLAQTEMMWIDRACVGWSGGPQYITIDLEQVKPIGGVGYRTQSRGASGVGWPPFILVMVSDDGKEFRLAGELVALSSKFGAPPDEGRFKLRADEYNEKIAKNPLDRAVYQAAEPPHWFRTDELKTRGRYVRLAVQSSVLVVSDEIEVYEGTPSDANAEVAGPVVRDPLGYLNANAMPYAMSARLATDAARAIELVGKLKLSDAASKPILAKLEQLRSNSLNVELKQYDPDFRAIVPLSPEHANIFAALSAAYRAAGYPEFTFWHNNPWVRQSPFDLPPALADGKVPEARLDVYTLHNDRRGEAMNLGNFGDGDRTAIVTFSGLPGGAKPAYVRVRQAEYLAMQSRVWDADPLPLAEETSAGWKVSLPAGVSRQLWFDFKPDTKSCPAGKFAGQVVVQVEGGPKLSFPITLHVADARLPEFKDRALAIGVRDFMDQGGPGGLIGSDKTTGKPTANFAPALKQLQESGVNVAWGRRAWGSRGTFPSPVAAGKGQKVEVTPGMPLAKLVRLPYATDGKDLFDAQDNLQIELDYTAFDAWVKQWPNARFYAISAEATWDYGGIMCVDPLSRYHGRAFTASERAATEKAQRRLGSVMKQWAAHMARVGVKPSQIVIVPVDEADGMAAFRRITHWARAIKQAVPEFKLFLASMVPPFRFDDRSTQDAFELLDIIVTAPDYGYYWQGPLAIDFYEGWRKQGKTVGFYSRSQNPSTGEATTDFRAEQWDCWRISKGGPTAWAGVWNYSDYYGTRLWNPLPGGGKIQNLCAAYIDSASATDGKHWLAIFEGANDYGYLRLLKQRIDELEKTGTKSAEVEAAKKVLAEVPDQVFEAAHYQSDAAACDAGRLRVWEAIHSLTSGK